MTHILLILQLIAPGVASWSTVGEFGSIAACNLAGSLLVSSNSGTTTNFACMSKEVDITVKRQ